MPQLPFAGFTAETRGRGPGPAGAVPSVRIPAPVEPGTGAKALAEFGQEVSRFGRILLERETENESRQVQVNAAKASAQFAEELQRAVETGEDFEKVAERNLERYDNTTTEINTAPAAAKSEVTRVGLEQNFSNAIRMAQTARTKKEARTQTQDMTNILGTSVIADPATLPAAIQQMDEFVDTFSLMPAEDRAIIKQSAANQLTMASANSMLQKDPLVLQEALTTEGSFPAMTPSQRSQMLSRSEAEINRRKDSAGAKDAMAQLILRQSLDTEAEDHVLTNEEAPDWFAQGITAAQFQAAQNKSIAVQEAKDKVNNDVNMILTGSGSVLTTGEYETALQKLTSDAVRDLPPQEQRPAATGIRLEAAVENGREDSKLKAILNAGPAAGEATFMAGLELRSQMIDRSPELYQKTVDSQSRMWYNAFDYMTQELGLPPDTAKNRLFEFSDNLKEAESRLGSKENRKLITDVVEADFEGQNFVIQKQVKDRAAAYMALVPTITAKQAVEIAGKDFNESTQNIGGGVRARREFVPVDWEEADDYVRKVALKRDLEAAGIDIPEEDLDELTFIPNDAETTAVIGLDNLTIFPRWRWQRAVDEWRVAVREPEVQRQQELAKAIRRRDILLGGRVGMAAMGGL